MQIRITQDICVEHAGREFKHRTGQVLDSSDHPLGPRFSELLNAGSAEPVQMQVATATVETGDKAVRRKTK